MLLSQAFNLILVLFLKLGDACLQVLHLGAWVRKGLLKLWLEILDFLAQPRDLVVEFSLALLRLFFSLFGRIDWLLQLLLKFLNFSFEVLSISISFWFQRLKHLLQLLALIG